MIDKKNYIIIAIQEKKIKVNFFRKYNSLIACEIVK